MYIDRNKISKSEISTKEKKISRSKFFRHHKFSIFVTFEYFWEKTQIKKIISEVCWDFFGRSIFYGRFPLVDILKWKFFFLKILDTF